MGSNLHPSLAENLHPSLADDLHGGVVSDWRYAVTGIQAAFYAGDSQQYVTLVGSAIDDITDAIPASRKTVTEAPYVLSAPAVGRRPVLSGQGMVFTAANLEALIGDVGLAPLVDGTQPCTIMVRGGWVSGATNRDMASAANPSVDSNYVETLISASGVFAVSRRNPTIDTITGGAGTTAATMAMVYNGTQHAIYRDGALAVAFTATAQQPSCSRFSLGNLCRLTEANHFNGTMYEVLVCLAALDATEIGDVHGQLVARYP